MEFIYEICGTQIPVSTIKEFRLTQKEYIYRPVYREADKSLLNVFSGKKYAFLSMQPYAAIFDETTHKSALKEFKARNLKESFGKEVAEGVVTSLADKLNIKTLKYQKYKCINLAGRVFTTYLVDVPAVLLRLDGKVSDVRKDDELYTLLGEPISPTIEFVPALEIIGERSYCFYGNGIQVDNIAADYERLKEVMMQYNLSKAQLQAPKSKVLLPHIPQIKLPTKGARAKMLPEDSVIIEEESR